MLLRSVDDQHINTVFPITFAEYNKWDRQGLPPEAVYKAMYDELGSVIPNRVDTTGLEAAELKRKRSQEIGKSLTRMNYSKSGWKSLIKKTRKQILKNIKKKSIKNKIDPKITSRIWKNMIMSYIDFEKRNFKKK